MKYGGAGVGGGLLAGCTEQSESGSTPDFTSTETTETDGEGLLEAVPDVIFLDNGIADLEWFEEQRQTLREDAVMSEVAAVQNDRIYPGGTAVQDPIVNIFQTEMAAKQLSPEEFGEWHGLGETPDARTDTVLNASGTRGLERYNRRCRWPN
jgi:hypothetical protein